MQTDWTALREELLGERDWALPPRIKMPMLPGALTEFLQRSADPGAGAKELGSIVETDAGLTFELLKLVNSSAIGLRRQANSASHAISLLGIQKVKLFVVTTAVRRAITDTSPLLDAQAFWNTNLERALFARRVAMISGLDAELAYAGGMLQDFLLPVLVRQGEELYTAHLNSAAGVDLHEYERSRIGWDHAFAAAQLAHVRGLPDDLVCCIALHHHGLDVLSDLRFRATAAPAVAISALIPDPMRQVSGGLELLVDVDAAWPEFDLQSVADEVAREFAEAAPQQADRHRTLADACTELLAETAKGDE